MNTQRLSRQLRRFRRATEGVSALEYAILVGVVSIAIVAALGLFSGELRDAIVAIGGSLETDVSPAELKKAVPAPSG